MSSETNHCVYFHRVQGRGIFYIGMGLPKRPMDRSSRSKAWNEVVKANPNYEICILENRAKMSVKMAGLGNPMFGKTHSQNARNRIRVARTGSKASAETRAKMSARHIGKHKTQLYVFVHPQHGYVVCTQYELQRRFDLIQCAVSLIVSNRRRTTKGWRVL